MHLLHEDQIDISGFASVRERVLLLDRHFFKQVIPDDCFDGLGGCVYLANAWFSPHGSTGLHHHRGLDIVSLIPRGQILHQGTIGDGVRVNAGQVQIQRDGRQGFSHNEINPTAAVQPMIQLWINPQWTHPGSSGAADHHADSYHAAAPDAYHAGAPDYQIVTIEPGVTCVYGGELFAAAMRVDVIDWPEGGVLPLAGEALLYVWGGGCEVRKSEMREREAREREAREREAREREAREREARKSEVRESEAQAGESQSLLRGHLLRGRDFSIVAERGLQALLIRTA
ncbi:pirin family protein [Thalassolituus sp. LLYu03]|uniref:pirin family protein n=1 Tax=Thalassolituus sp. LLYu03 TaxID=3421656 RepID=UPI003D27D626